MKLKFTPLSIITALCLSLGLFLLFIPKQERGADRQLGLVFGALAMAGFLVDMISRVLVKDLKMLWIIESLLIFAVILCWYLFIR